MFLRRYEPLLLTEEGLDGLCPSLNRPIVEVEGLPVGPASAAIAVYGSIDGAPGLAVALRSEESGAVVVYSFQGEPAATLHDAMDAGLTFAEGLGFLFDDDLLASGDRAGRLEAVVHWCRLMGDEPPSGGPPAEEPLLLDDLVELEEELPAEADPLAPAPASMLSKFRLSPDAELSPGGQGGDRDGKDALGQEPGDEPDDGSGAALGRIPIVRRRSKGSGSEATMLLARLLARF
jgi:hypothetical protein